ncbi:MAG: hypothetical protein IIT36_02545 [Aeriscardovia sp.]|nr:hypothetical protein [Aeriscardovia sp.]
MKPNTTLRPAVNAIDEKIALDSLDRICSFITAWDEGAIVISPDYDQPDPTAHHYSPMFFLRLLHMMTCYGLTIPVMERHRTAEGYLRTPEQHLLAQTSLQAIRDLVKNYTDGDVHVGLDVAKSDADQKQYTPRMYLRVLLDEECEGLGMRPPSPRSIPE